jgi:hypothetical protein
MEHYVTLFDSLFLPQGLALHTSMMRHLKDFTLWVLCVDDNTHDVLSQMGLQNVRLLRLSTLETAELLAVKPWRTKGEYCWTLTPFAPRFVFEADAVVNRVTYLDADLWFRKDPSAIFSAFQKSGKGVLITEHAYAPEQDHSATSGLYCVQFMTFVRNDGETVRKWWEEKCLDWCFARFEDGRFGDQKYLDDWPDRFPDHVHVLEDKELLLAPWNATRFPYSSAVAWHFHSFRINCRGRRISAEFGPYPLPRTTRLNVYGEYVKDIARAIGTLESKGVAVISQSDPFFLDIAKGMIRKFAYNFRYSGYAHRERIS